MNESFLRPPFPETQILAISQFREQTSFLADLKRYRRAEEIAHIIISRKYGSGLKGKLMSALYSGVIAGDYMTRRSRIAR